MSGKSANEESSSISGVLVLSTVIVQSIEDLKKGQRKGYDSLVQTLGDPNLKPLHLTRYLRALRICVSCLTKESDTLVGAVLAVKWATEDDETVAEFVEFLTSLLSAQTYYLRACLRMLVKLFLPNILKDVDPGDINMEVHEKAFSNAHEALQGVLEIVPIAPKFLLPVLCDCFPYMKKATIYQECYIRNLFHLMHYLPSMRPNIMELIVDELIKIDVEVPKHELEEGELEDEDENTQFELDMDTHQMEGEKPEVEKSMENEAADKLDKLLVIFFSTLHEECYTNGVYNVVASTELFNELLVIFEKVILCTHASHHVQFIMFYMCSMDQIFANSFLDLCWKKIENPNTAAILRQSSAAYMASLVARIKSIPVSIVQTCLDLLMHWIHGYIDVHDAKCHGPDVNKYGPFYSTCQAVFYMFVFRHKQLLELENGLKYIRKLNFERVVTCRLNPLKACLATVVKMFAVVTRNHEVVFCYTIIERNSRMMIPVASTASHRAVSHFTFLNILDSFFPFDPYLLRRSSKFIKHLYQEWEGVGTEEEEEEDEDDVKDAQDEDREDYQEDREDYQEYAKSPDATVPGFTPETPMAVSPGFLSSPQHRLTMHQHYLR